MAARRDKKKIHHKLYIEFLQQGTFGIYLKKFSGETKEWAGEGVVVVEGIPLQFTGLYFTQHPSSLILHTIHQSLERETKKKQYEKHHLRIADL